MRRLEAALVVVAALLAVGFWIRRPYTLPSESDWTSAAARVAAAARPGDAVLLDPHWAERARLFVQAGPVLNLGRAPSRADVAEFERLLVLSLPDVPSPTLPAAGALLPRLGYSRREGPWRHGAVEVAIYGNDRVERPVYDFTAQVEQAKVYIRRPDGSEELCPLLGKRHSCPRAPWLFVADQTKEIALKPVRCLWAHPAGQEPLVVSFTQVPLGRELRVRGGIVGQIAFRTERFKPVVLRTKIDGSAVAELEFPPGEPGERSRTVDTASLAGTPHDVQFEVTAEDPGMRHFCFDAGAY